jgi:enterochelin esterase family protein
LALDSRVRGNERIMTGGSAPVRRLLVCLSAMVCLGAGPACAGGRLLTGQIPSPSLGRPIPYSVYLPESEPEARRLPVLYLLHGRGDDETTWNVKGDIAATLDRKIARGEMRPMIVVMPAVRNSWYIDDPRPDGFGPYAMAFMQDFMPGIEARYPIARCQQGRGIGGVSMGGYGAVLYALSDPDRFAAAFSLSGSLFGEDAREIAARRAAYERIFEGAFGAPFDVQRFLDWNVFMRLERNAAAVRRLSFWLMAGEDDFVSIRNGTIRLHAELQRRGIPSELAIVKGGHTWDIWQNEVSPALSWLSAHLDPACTTD